MRGAGVVLVGLLLALTVTACTDSAGDREPDPPSEPMALSLLVFNVEYGGNSSTDRVIEDVGADVVSVLESYDKLPQIAADTGYPYYNVALQILSKFPILEPSGADGRYAFLEVRPGEGVAIINTHLDHVLDGPNRLERGVPLEQVLATEREVRLSSIETLLPSVDSLLADGWPLLFTGDLNQPSHLDGDVPWPVSEALVGAGLRDSYRETHPDPVADPGHTWGQVAGSGGSPRRIDYAYVGGPVDVEDTDLVGEEGAAGVDRGYPDWTSDHRAVLAQLEVEPVALPPMIALSSRLTTVGDTVTATYRLPPGPERASVELDGPAPAAYDLTDAAGTFDVDTSGLEPGAYDVELRDEDGTVLATNELYVRPRGARVELTTDARRYGPGEPVTVRWTDGPANRWDWIGVWPAGRARPGTDDFLVWGYTGGHDAGALPPTTAGEMVLGRNTQGPGWPLPPGHYVVRYLLTDQYETAGAAEFIVSRGRSTG